MTNKEIIMKETKNWLSEKASGEVDVEQFTDNLLAKLQVLDRGNVENILYDCVMDNHEEYPVKEVLEKYVTKICQLIPKQNISNELLNKEIKKWMNSFSKEEWHKKLDEEKRIYEKRKLKEAKEGK